MKLKKVGVIFVNLFLVMFLLSFVSAVGCNVVLESSCEDYPVFALSGLTNAHGELLEQNNYDYVLCCDFGTGDTACSGTNAILKLADLTNAHGEIPTESNYMTPICYEDLQCVGKTSCNSSEMQILSLTATTNAHIGAGGDYTTKICCSNACGTNRQYYDGDCYGLTDIYWANLDGERINSRYVVADYSSVKLILKNDVSHISSEIDFEIFEDDSPFSGLIKTISATTDSNGSASMTWLISQDDIDEAESSLLEGELEPFYFKVGDLQSNDLNLTIGADEECSFVNLCMNYENQEQCESDFCNVGEYSVELEDENAVCGEVELTPDGCNAWSSCSCQWNSSSETCGPRRLDVIDEDCASGNPTSIGSCVFSEDLGNDCCGPDCPDDLLTYSWGADYVWDESNIFGLEKANLEGWVQDPEDVWHYDPLDKFAECQGGSRSVKCPAYIQLTFFNFTNVIIAILIIVLIYVIVISRKKSYKKKVIKKKNKKIKKR